MRAVLWKALTASPTATKVETPASEPDIAKAREYLEALSPDETEFTFQTFDDKKLSRRLARVLNGRRDAHFERLCALSRQGAGACVTINRTDLKGRKTENVVETRAAFVDLDGAPIDNWKRLSLRPHMGVRSSPGRAHLYYRVKGIGLDEWPEIQDRLRVLMEGDDAVCDLPRVMRLPGFPHQKYDPFMVEGAYTPNLPNAYTRDGFLKALDEAEVACRPLRFSPTLIKVIDRTRSLAARTSASIISLRGLRLARRNGSNSYKAPSP